MSLELYNENENRAYPFISNDTLLKNCEILDCAFYIKNKDNVDVWLSKKDESSTTVSYIFTFDGCQSPLQFTVNKSDQWQCARSSNNIWSGYCIIGPSDR